MCNLSKPTNKGTIFPFLINSSGTVIKIAGSTSFSILIGHSNFECSIDEGISCNSIVLTSSASVDVIAWKD